MSSSGSDQPLILGIGGALRFGSSSGRALRIALDSVERLGTRTRVVEGAQLDLPAFDVTLDPNEAAAFFVEQVRQADGLLIATPSYHGGVSGLLKNALDHVEALSSDRRPYLSGRAVGLIATGDGWQGPNATLAAMRALTHALRGWPTPLGVAHNVKQGGAAGARTQLETVAEQVLTFARSFDPHSPADRTPPPAAGRSAV
ncbi:NAD(P)H-dependent oxidoreductase [Thermoleophilia bacterium SCSIO 60948]|nr:NAD(P)H-dependent oxidoreductase [Thermoleophilia bacterium SCSIO 60948]